MPFLVPLFYVYSIYLYCIHILIYFFGCTFSQDQKGQLHQVWYDDPESICLKASLVKAKGLRGIGMWNGNLLNYIDESARQQTNSMWNALVQC